MNEEKINQEAPINQALEHNVIPSKPEELSDMDLEAVAGGSARNSARDS
jgi:hypothetical protein